MKNKLFKTFELIALLIIISSCKGVDSAKKEVDLTKLLIGVNDLPPNWSESGRGDALEPNRGGNSMGVGFYSDLYPESLASVQEVYLHLSVNEAQTDIVYVLKEYKNNNEFFPEHWNFKSDAADESYLSCEYSPNYSFPLCKWLARYGVIVVQFRSWLIPERMTLLDMENIVELIDIKISGEIQNK